MDDSGQHAIESVAYVGTLTHGTRPDCNWYVSVVFALPAFALCTQFICTVAVAFITLLPCSYKLLHCSVPGCSDFSSAVVLEMHACVGRDQLLCCLLFLPRHQHVAYGKTRNSGIPSGIPDENFERVTRSKIAKWVCPPS